MKHQLLPLLVLFLAVSCGRFVNAEESEFVWLARAGGPGADKARGLTADPEGNSYLTGEFSGEADFGDFTLTSRGESDFFLARLDAGGTPSGSVAAGGRVPIMHWTWSPGRMEMWLSPEN